MTSNIINYNVLIDEAMHSVVRKSLSYIHNNQLPGNHYFFITFFTKNKGVSISPNLLQKYPKEMTIVLQHRFEDLIVEDSKFSITLTFDGIREIIAIPYQAITSFIDPSVKFALQFYHETVEKLGSLKDKKHTIKNAEKIKANNIITLDHFRNKKKITNQ